MRCTNQQQLLLLCNTCAKPCTLHSAHDCGVCTGIGGSGRSKNFEKGQGGEDNLSARSSFIANAHNEIYAFHMEKSGFLKKNIRQWGRSPTFPPLNLPLIGGDLVQDLGKGSVH